MMVKNKTIDDLIAEIEKVPFFEHYNSDCYYRAPSEIKEDIYEIIREFFRRGKMKRAVKIELIYPVEIDDDAEDIDEAISEAVRDEIFSSDYFWQFNKLTTTDLGEWEEEY